ncbi:hypothetical protein ACN08Y_10740 [Rothia sp. P5764]|uniref:hypothetical protein n=1 Tax=Rothia sp. P5764 TaxID=3402654 RepID=UPI003ACB8ECD
MPRKEIWKWKAEEHFHCQFPAKRSLPFFQQNTLEEEIRNPPQLSHLRQFLHAEETTEPLPAKTTNQHRTICKQRTEAQEHNMQPPTDEATRQSRKKTEEQKRTSTQSQHRTTEPTSKAQRLKPTNQPNLIYRNFFTTHLWH